MAVSNPVYGIRSLTERYNVEQRRADSQSETQNPPALPDALAKSSGDASTKWIDSGLVFPELAR